MTRSAIGYRIRVEGPWQAVLPGVYLAHTGPLADDQRDMAALMYGGALSVLTGMAALRHHGLRAAAPPMVDVLVPAGIQRRSAGFVNLHRTARLPVQHCYEGQIRYALAPRAVADAARALPRLADVRAVVADSVQQGICPIARIADELVAGPVRGSARLRQVLAEVADGVRSAAEAHLRELIKRAHLPMPMFNPRLFVGREFLGSPDCWWSQAGVAAEVDSKEWHFSVDGWEKTLERHARMSVHGILVLHFTPRQVRVQPGAVAATIRQALTLGHALPSIRAIPAE